MYSAIWAYPWDLMDEGVDVVLERIASAGIDAISLASAYHTVRAICPHNPAHAVIHGEGGVIYFRANRERWENLRIQPVESQLLAQVDPLALLLDAAKRHGVKVHAWTVLHHNSRLGSAYPDCTLENAFGDRYPFGLCPAHPDVRAYSLALVQSLTDYPQLDSIELESLGYMGIDHTGHHSKTGVELDELHRFLLSVCFCPHCSERMSQHGVDVPKARSDVVQEIRGFFAGRYSEAHVDPVDALADVLGAEQAEGILAARDEVVLTLLEEIFWQVQKPQTLSIMVSGNPLATGAQAGITLSEARQWTDRLLTQAFHRDLATIRDTIAEVTIRRGSTPVFAGLQAIAPFVRSEDEMAARVTTAIEMGAEGIQFYHYGLMPLENLNWIRYALSAI